MHYLNRYHLLCMLSQISLLKIYLSERSRMLTRDRSKKSDQVDLNRAKEHRTYLRMLTTYLHLPSGVARVWIRHG